MFLVNYIPNTSRGLQDDSVFDSSQTGNQLKRQPSSPKHATINKQKQLRATIKTPDILNTESCVNLDLVPSSVEQCKKHNGQTAIVSPNPLKDERPVQRNNQEVIIADSVNLNAQTTKRDSNTSVNAELHPQCSKCVEEVNDCTSSEPAIPDVTGPQQVRTENLDSVMCSISNDLDYLLNRTSDFKAS